MRYVGARVRRVEDPRLLRGEGSFVADLNLPGMLYAGFVRSPYAHGRVRSINGSAAREIPGVVGVFTASDLPALGRPVPVTQISEGVRGHNFSPLATDTVRYMGEPLAVVVVEDPNHLEDALEAIAVEYDELSAVSDPEEAMHIGATIWEDVPDNVAGVITQGFGDIDAAFQEADLVVGERFAFPRAAGAAMEPRAVLAQPGGDDAHDLTVWSSTQTPHNNRDRVAEQLDLDASRVRVIAPDVGGGFGVKGRTYPEEYAVAAVALHLGRPVRWVATRTEDLMTTGQGRGQIHRARLAARADGTILALDDHLIQDVGAYTPSGVGVAANTARHLMGPYHLEAFRVRISAVYTNRVITVALRGGGRPEGIFVMERLLDRLADRLGLDRAEVRRRNLIPPGAFPYDTHFPIQGQGRNPTSGSSATVIYDSGDYPAYLQRTLEAIGYADFPATQKQARSEGRYLGLGFAVYIESTGMGAEGSRVEIGEDGRVHVAVGSPNQGQAHFTTFGQMAADRMGARLENVTVISGDTAAFPWGTGTFASRMGQYGGNAVSLAAQDVRQRVLEVAADLLEISPRDLDLTDGTVSVRGLPHRTVSLAEVAQAARERGIDLSAESTFQPTPSSAYAGGVNAAIVEVDIDTGSVRILRYVVVHDCGTIVNPTIVEGQIHGGVAHGIGNALWEACVYSPEGQFLTSTFADYPMPGPADLPPLEITHFETPSAFNPEGIKGAGEGGTIAAIPTIVSAVENALSPFNVTLSEVPLRPELLVRKVSGL